MKYAIIPEPWEETIEALDAAGHERVELKDAEFLVFNGQPDDFPELPESIGFVQVPFAGVDHILDLIRSTDVRWSNAAGLYDSTVAESTIALLLAQLHAHKRVDTWENRDEVEAHTSFLFEDKTVAILGAGGIGKRLIEMLSGFGVKIIAVNRSGRPVDGAETVPFSELESVWPRADYFVFLAPLTNETKHMGNAAAFKAMPSHAVVVNVGRGPLIDTAELIEALNAGEIAGAALDVTDPEPLPTDSPLWDMPHVVITPHLANPPYSVRRRIGEHTVRVAEAYAAGEPLPTEVDPEAGY
ncbi:D-isomer specific 2-hydroxyacid dehydrogenase family protein [Corynebacterium phoceense]|uniref:D-isomer specific 2-hydroxyacid dehydrogenase family protein n=1 Tax=Corynebacterium phoceense TaxID=1686286 RepID=UPI00211BEBBB|nr:D-isomer specific 2-hydroxyacid dehydrogenase family protein [Corynebacterium phoceense]MCQ9334102.1 D-isomer specific 2-hydroxyacid dehydrogenase family protein [Corynebacterium phoceense]MCQ9335655.1 D-isomer specific 2-hydroxyacid dehydrogenase family protein [Corynebacterium phoceense]